MLLSYIHHWIDQSSRIRIFLVLLFLGLLAYANAIHHPFVHDDVVFIEKNPYIGDLDLKDIFFRTVTPDEKNQLVNKYYRPLLDLVNRVLYRIIGLNPHGFHFFNILLHIINSFLVYLLVLSISGRRKGFSLVIALLFLLHPVQNEAVACISGVSNLVFAFLCLASFYAYLTAMHGKKDRRDFPLYGVSLVLFLGALLAKEQAVVLPFLVMAYEMCFSARSQRETVKKNWLPVAGLGAVLAGYFFLRKILFGFSITRMFDRDGEFWLRLLAIPRSLLTYGRLIFFPYDIHYYRSQDILLPFFWPLAGMIIVLLAMGWALYLAPKAQRKMMVFGLAWFLISLVPTSNIVPLFNEYSQILTAEHFLYFPLMGMLLFVAEPVHYWMTRADSGRRMHMVFVGLASVMILCIATVVRLNTYWRGEIPLFERTLHYEKNFGRVRILLAQAYASAGRLEDAIAENRRALAIMQDYNLKTSKKEVKEFYLHFIKEIRYHLGTCLDALGNWEGALEEFKEVQRLDPQNRVIYYTLGLGYLKAGDINSAVGHFEKALALNPKDLMIMNSLAICYQETGENAKAEKLLRTIAEKDKASVSAQENLRAFLQKTSIRSSDTGVTSGE